MKSSWTVVVSSLDLLQDGSGSKYPRPPIFRDDNWESSKSQQEGSALIQVEKLDSKGDHGVKSQGQCLDSKSELLDVYMQLQTLQSRKV